MALIGTKLRSIEGGRVAFECPGCGMMHQVRVEGSLRPRWEWNGDGHRPTFSPSILVEDGHYVDPAGKWCDRSGGDEPCECLRCHSFVRDGMIQFLGDCTHALAGQTVALPDLD